MVALAAMGWLSEVGNKLKRSAAAENSTADATPLGILAFETAKTMSCLVSLYKSLADSEFSKLKEVIKSEGVAYLNSNDEAYLLSLACAERLEDLDRTASTVARLGHKCSDPVLNRFEFVYADLKLGLTNFGKLEYGSREVEKRLEKMEKLVNATTDLYMALEALSELEVSERKIKQWKPNKANLDLFYQKLAYQRKQVRHLRETSLWGKTFDKSVGLMARIICVVYARILTVFNGHIPSLPRGEQPVISRSGPIQTAKKPCLVRFHSHRSNLFNMEDSVLGANNRVFHLAAPSTVGGSGLALRYANVIVMAENYLDSEVTVDDEGREKIYEMLPENLRRMVRSKLRKLADAEEDGGEALAEGWRVAVGRIMAWLEPVARDTLTWQAEGSVEKAGLDSKPSVLLVQTLHFADKEKAEAAIAEVLVGLSYICLYENRRSSDDDDDWYARCASDGVSCPR
ncbi:hypothetical protein NMG60_11000335 [Bertholletia excelsa]